MKKLLLVLSLVIGAYSSQAQSDNKSVIKQAEKESYYGNITHPIGQNEYLNIGYKFFPKQVEESLNYYFHTPYPEPISFNILNASGKDLKRWSITESNYIQQGKIDVSDLKKGNYTLVIYHNNVEAKRISITKK